MGNADWACQNDGTNLEFSGITLENAQYVARPDTAIFGSDFFVGESGENHGIEVEHDEPTTYFDGPETLFAYVYIDRELVKKLVQVKTGSGVVYHLVDEE